MAKQEKAVKKPTKPKKLKAGVSVFEDRDRLAIVQRWNWDHYCSRCGGNSKTVAICSECDNRG